MTAIGVNIIGTDFYAGANTVTLPGYAATDVLTFSKPLAASSGGRLLWDAWSSWPDDVGAGPPPVPVLGQTWGNYFEIYGNNGGADTLLFTLSATNGFFYYTTIAEAFAAAAALLPVTATGYTTYKVVTPNDPMPVGNRGGASILVEVDDPTSGVSYPLYAGAVYAMVTGAADPDFSVQNLDDMVSVRSVFLATAPGAIALTFTRLTAADIRFLGLLHHNADPAATFRWRLFGAGAPDPATNAANLIYDSTALPFYPAGAEKSDLFPAVTPHILPAYAHTLCGRLDLSAQADAWEIGALAIAGWWDWPAISVPRELGVENTDVVVLQTAGADHGMAQWAPRVMRGDRSEIIIADEQAKILNFQFDQGVSRPFVWVRDYSDPATWPNECFVARNSTVPTLNKAVHPVGKFAFDLIEALR